MKRLGLLFLTPLLGLSLLSGCAVDQKIEFNQTRTLAFDYFSAGQNLEARGQFLLAREQFQKAYEVSKRPSFAYKLGETYHVMGEPENALPYYEEALAMAPDYELAEAQRDLALLQIKEGAIITPPEITELTEEEVASRAYSAPIFAAPTMASTPYESRDLDEIENNLFPELTTEELDIVVIKEQAETAMLQGRWDDAVNSLQALTSRDRSMDSGLKLANALYMSGRRERAFEEFAKLAEQYPNEPDVPNQWGTALAKADQWEKAETVFLDAIEHFSSSTKLEINLGALYLESGQYEQSAHLLEKAWNESPDSMPALYNLIILEARRDQQSRALELLEQLKPSSEISTSDIENLRSSLQ